MKSLVASRAAVCSPTARELPGLKIGGAAGRSQNLEAFSFELDFLGQVFRPPPATDPSPGRLRRPPSP